MSLPVGQVFTVCKRLSHTHINFLPDISTILHSLPYSTIQQHQKVVYTQSLTEIKSIRKTAIKADLYTYSTIPKVGVITGWEGTKTSGFLPWRSIRVSWMNTPADTTPTTSASSSTKVPPHTQDVRVGKSKEEGVLVNLWELSPFNRDELIDLVYPTSDDATGKTESDSTSGVNKAVSSKDLSLCKGDASDAADVAGEGMGEELSGTGTGRQSTSSVVVAAKRSGKK